MMCNFTYYQVTRKQCVLDSCENLENLDMLLDASK